MVLQFYIIFMFVILHQYCTTNSYLLFFQKYKISNCAVIPWEFTFEDGITKFYFDSDLLKLILELPTCSSNNEVCSDITYNANHCIDITLTPILQTAGNCFWCRSMMWSIAWALFYHPGLLKVSTICLIHNTQGLR